MSDGCSFCYSRVGYRILSFRRGAASFFLRASVRPAPRCIEDSPDRSRALFPACKYVEAEFSASLILTGKLPFLVLWKVIDPRPRENRSIPALCMQSLYFSACLRAKDVDSGRTDALALSRKDPEPFAPHPFGV